jgi:hypothetical protein
LTFILLRNRLCHYKDRIFGRKIVFYGGLGTVKISCRRFKGKNINIVISNSPLSHEVSELAIIQPLSLHLSPLPVPLNSNSGTRNLVTPSVQVITFVEVMLLASYVQRLSCATWYGPLDVQNLNTAFLPVLGI